MPFRLPTVPYQERHFVLAARQAPLSHIAAVLLEVRRGRAVIDSPGKVEGLGIAASHKCGEAELEGATAVLSSVSTRSRRAVVTRLR